MRRCDVTDPDARRALRARPRPRGPSTSLVNNAGAAESAPFAKTSLAQLAAHDGGQPDRRLPSAARRLLPACRGRAAGASSTSPDGRAARAMPMSRAYCAAKHGAGRPDPGAGRGAGAAGSHRQRGLPRLHRDRAGCERSIASIAAKTGRSRREARRRAARGQSAGPPGRSRRRSRTPCSGSAGRRRAGDHRPGDRDRGRRERDVTCAAGRGTDARRRARRRLRLWLRLLGCATDRGRAAATAARRVRHHAAALRPDGGARSRAGRADHGRAVARLMVSNGNVTGSSTGWCADGLVARDRAAERPPHRTIVRADAGRAGSRFAAMAAAMHELGRRAARRSRRRRTIERLLTLLGQLQASRSQGRPGGGEHDAMADFAPKHFLLGGARTGSRPSRSNRPERKNPLTFETYAELRDTVPRAAPTPSDVEAVVVLPAPAAISARAATCTRSSAR